MTCRLSTTFAALLLAACASAPPAAPPAPAAPAILADALSVSATGEPGAATFAVTVKSPDTGCDRYADWWEVLDQDGALLYRRILEHSHPGEQPFTRSGGPVPAAPDQTLWVRVHLHPDGYGGAALKGTISGGFSPAQLDASFAPGLDRQTPLPQSCLF